MRKNETFEAQFANASTERGVHISGLEANLLLYLLDEFIDRIRAGTVDPAKYDYGMLKDPDASMLMVLRERLFAAHEHPDEDEQVPR